MFGAIRRFPFRPTQMLGVCLITLGGVLYVEHRKSVALDDSKKNYTLIYSTPSGWKAIPHSPQAIFLYRNLKNRLLMRAAMSDIVADYNPDPELDTDGTAKWMLDVTAQNLHDWKGELMDTVQANGVTFRLVRRWNPVKVVYSAVGVRGNTTVIVTMSADKQEIPYIEGQMPQFRQYLASLQFRRHIWDEGS